ncbi:MAG: hypothetical protein KJN90_00085, partial [Gammaproteobacteria bacterium]|nr:hypothetical protein [Gammaproteobacteria bacterium]
MHIFDVPHSAEVEVEVEVDCMEMENVVYQPVSATHTPENTPAHTPGHILAHTPAITSTLT